MIRRFSCFVLIVTLVGCGTTAPVSPSITSSGGRWVDDKTFEIDNCSTSRVMNPRTLTLAGGICTGLVGVSALITSVRTETTILGVAATAVSSLLIALFITEPGQPEYTPGYVLAEAEGYSEQAAWHDCRVSFQKVPKARFVTLKFSNGNSLFVDLKRIP